MIAVGPMSRTPVSEKNYSKYKLSHPKSEVCGFCDIVAGKTREVIDETEACVVVANKFAYDLWDGCGVEEHLMVLPKAHVDSLYDLTDNEKIDYMNTASKYEKLGYSLYARSPGNATKSVVHQHMHLIKIDNQPKKWILYLRRPHILAMNRKKTL